MQRLPPSYIPYPPRYTEPPPVRLPRVLTHIALVGFIYALCRLVYHISPFSRTSDFSYRMVELGETIFLAVVSGILFVTLTLSRREES